MGVYWWMASKQGAVTAQKANYTLATTTKKKTTQKQCGQQVEGR